MSRCTEHESIWKPRKREDPLKLEHCLKRFVERCVSHAIQHGGKRGRLHYSIACYDSVSIHSPEKFYLALQRSLCKSAKPRLLQKTETYTDARKFGYAVSVHPSAPYALAGRDEQILKGRNGESKTCSLSLSWRNVNPFTQRKPMEFLQKRH